MPRRIQWGFIRLTVKHAIMLTKAGIPLFSFDFKKGTLHVDSVLFSGLISAIHSFIDDIIIPDVETKTGFITSSNMDVMYCKGDQIVSVLVGSELKTDFEERLSWITREVDGQIDFDIMSISSDDPRALGIADFFKFNLMIAFTSQSIQGYHTPLLIKDKNEVLEYVSSSPHRHKYQDYLVLVTGKLSLYEIFEFTSLSWIDLLMMTSELVNSQHILLNTEINKEQIFKLTEKGMDLIFELEPIPEDLMQNWDGAILPFLNKIDGYRSYGEITEELEDILSERDIYQLTTSVNLLLIKEIIQPVSSLVQLGVFIQNFYLNFYQYLLGRVGHAGEKIFMEKINRNMYIRMIVPDFVNNRLSSIEKFYHLMRRSTIEDNNNLIAHIFVIVKDTIDALADELSTDVILDLEQTIWKETCDGNQRLIDKYLLNDLYHTIVIE